MKMRASLAVAMALGVAWTSEAASSKWPDAMEYLMAAEDCSIEPDATLCENRKNTWQNDYRGAIAGEYQGQRNVSFCLSTGCDDLYGGNIRKNAILACAWRVVIVNSGHLEADDTDAMNLKHFCGPEYLDDTGRGMANAQAKTLLRKLGVSARLP